MAGVHQVEAAAGESDAAAGGALGADPLVDGGVGEHFLLGVCRRQVGSGNSCHAPIIAWVRPGGPYVTLAHSTGLRWRYAQVQRA